MSQDSLDPEFRQRLRAELTAHVRRETTPAGHRREARRRTVPVLVGLSVGIAVVAAGMAALPHAEPVVDAGEVTVRCLAGVVSEPSEELLGMDVEVTAGHGLADRAIEACSALWAAGALSSAGGALSSDVELQTSAGDGAQSGGTESTELPRLELCGPDEAPVVVPWLSCDELSAVLDGG